jgi:predicted NodU family carbamoyl transferase
MGRNKKTTGLGDVIANITEAVGIKPCKGCKQRQAKLNALLPFGTEELLESEKTYLNDFFENTPSELSKTQQNELLDIYFRVYRVKPFAPCTNCSGVWKSIIKKLKKLDYA